MKFIPLIATALALAAPAAAQASGEMTRSAGETAREWTSVRSFASDALVCTEAWIRGVRTPASAASAVRLTYQRAGIVVQLVFRRYQHRCGSATSASRGPARCASGGRSCNAPPTAPRGSAFQDAPASSSRRWCASATAIAPSPTAPATRLIEALRASPAAKRPGTLARRGVRAAEPPTECRCPACALGSSTTLSQRPCSSLVRGAPGPSIRGQRESARERRQWLLTGPPVRGPRAPT